MGFEEGSKGILVRCNLSTSLGQKQEPQWLMEGRSSGGWLVYVAAWQT